MHRTKPIVDLKAESFIGNRFVVVRANFSAEYIQVRCELQIQEHLFKKKRYFGHCN